MADQLAYRMKQRPVRTAAATSTVVVSIFYLLAQMVGAGALVTLLLGVEGELGDPRHDRRRRPADDLLRRRRRHEGHHLGADRQGRAADDRHRADHGPGAGASSTSTSPSCSARPPTTPGKGEAFLQPGLQYGATLTTQIDFISLALALVLGTAGLPHILIRFYTVPTAKDARTSVQLGDHAHRRLLPDVAGARLRCGGAARHRSGERRSPTLGRQPGLTAAGRGGRRRRGHRRWRDPARLHRGGRVRDDPGRGRRTDADLGVVGGARHLRQRDQEGRA